jgi:putative ABC transport system ATP-binding protein
MYLVGNMIDPLLKLALATVEIVGMTARIPEPASRRNVVEMDGVAKEYALGEHTVTALRHVTLQVREGAFVAIAGPSGSGKSTLLNLIGCIDTPSRGQLRVAGHLINGRRADELAMLRARNIGFVFQTFNLFPVLSAEENVEYPLLHMEEVSRAERRERVAHFLNVVQLAHLARHRPNQLSGGQRQRVAIARALVTQPDIVLADEPTANLDHRTGEAILALMRDINRRFGTTFVFSTHDRKVIEAADRLVAIEDGAVRYVAVRSHGRWVAETASVTAFGAAPDAVSA